MNTVPSNATPTTSLVGSYKPKLRADSFFIPGPDGTYFHNARGWYKLTPKIPYGLVERVVPLLDGTRPMDALTHNLSQAQSNAVGYFVQMLSEHGFVRDQSTDQSAIKPDIARTYQRELAFLETLGESPTARFGLFREARVLIDAAVMLEPVLTGLWSLGLKSVQVAGGEGTVLRRLTQTRAAGDAEQTAIAVGQIDSLALGGFDLVVQIAADTERARRLATHCTAAGVFLLQGVLSLEEAWLQLPNRETFDALSFWERSRLEQNASVLKVEQAWRGPRGVVISNLVAHHAFCFLTNCVQKNSAALRLNRSTFESTKHRIVPHMVQRTVGIRSQDEARQDFAVLMATETTSEDGFSKRAARLIDPKLGVLSELNEHSYTQMPLNIAQALARDARDGSPLPAFGVATDFAGARVRAAMRALELYAATAFDERRFRLDRGVESVWALDLVTQQPRLIPAQVAFPRLNGVQPSSVTMPGLASGLNWQSALKASLLALLMNRTMLEQAPLDVARLDLDVALTDSQALRYRKILLEMDTEVRVVSVLGQYGGLIALIGDKPVAIWADTDPQLALRGLLERCVQYQQSLLHKEPDYRPEPIPNSLEMRSVSGVARLEQENGIEGLIGFFERNGYHPCVMALDHDPAVQSSGLMVVHAVLIREEKP